MPSIPSNDEARRLQLLTSQLCDQNIDADHTEELAALLHGNADNIATYCAITSLHLDLSQELRAPMEVTTSQIGKGRPASWWSRVSRQQKSLAAIAAVLLVGLTVWLTNRVEELDYTARIVEKIDCNWGEDQWGASKSNLLDVGREIELERGLMVVEFASGAEVMLEAPVRFAVVTASRGRLDRGKLTAHVDERGRGFAIDMPGVELVDLGTRFGALVDETGACEAHVFEGSIELRAGEQGEARQKLSLARGEAIQFNKANRASHRIAARPEAFIHADRFTIPSPASGEAMLGLAGRDDVHAWFHAGRQLQFDEADQVVVWGNLIRSGEQKRHAWQVDAKSRPKYVRDDGTGRPALRFDGDDHLEISPFAATSDLTFFCAFRFRDATRGATMLDLGGPARLQLDHPAVTTLLDDRIVIAGCTYDRDANLAKLYLNGTLVDSWGGDGFDVPGTSTVIGANLANENHFVGDLYEVAVLNTRLTTEEYRALCAEWLDSYRIPTDDAEPRILAPPHAGKNINVR